MKKKIAIVFIIILAVIFVFVMGSKVAGSKNQAAVYGSSTTPEKINEKNLDNTPKNIIVVFKDDVSDVDNSSNDIAKKNGGSVSLKYSSAIKGFAGNFPGNSIAKIKTDPRVEFISEDLPIEIQGKLVKEGVVQKAQVQPTGVSRIGASTLTNKGAGINIAIIDTGIDLTHPDLSGNILNSGASCVTGAKNGNDDNGHGTHVAGIIAAINNTVGVVGVAPSAKLIPVKVLDRNGSGSWSSVVCGIDWVVANATKYGIKVANMSLGGSGSSDNNCGNSNNDALHKAICRLRNAGVIISVAAGNSGANASGFVPAAYTDSVISVSALSDSDGLPGGLGSTTSFGYPDDTFASFSNFGDSVAVGAPGVDILSTYKGGTYATMSGTSMASPYTTGAIALYIKKFPGSSWTVVRDALKSIGEIAGQGHTNSANNHPEPVIKVSTL